MTTRDIEQVPSGSAYDGTAVIERGGSEEAIHWTDESPLDRLARLGMAALSAAELLALLLPPVGVGEGVPPLPARVLSRFPLLTGPAQASLPELIHEFSRSPSQAAAVPAACELGRRLYAAPPTRRTAIRTPADVVALVSPEMRYLDCEHFRVVLLNTRHHVLAVEEVAVGGLNSAVIHPREVFKAAIRARAAAVILVHNHPSGDPEPSADDLRITARLREAGRVVGIEVLDHVVVRDGRYVSLRERGHLTGSRPATRRDGWCGGMTP